MSYGLLRFCYVCVCGHVHTASGLWRCQADTVLSEINWPTSEAFCEFKYLRSS